MLFAVSTVRMCTVFTRTHTVLQYSTVQYSTVQYSTVRYSTVQCAMSYKIITSVLLINLPKTKSTSLTATKNEKFYTYVQYEHDYTTPLLHFNKKVRNKECSVLKISDGFSSVFYMILIK